MRQLRMKAGLSQAGLAREAGLPLRSIQNWEQGHRLPRVDCLLPLAAALGVAVEALLVNGDAAAGKPVRKRKAKHP
jgi:transcriptional regulator with XRE-family HTH domain